MKKLGIIISAVILIIIIAVIVVLTTSSNNQSSNSSQGSGVTAMQPTDNGIIHCDDMQCFGLNFLSCKDSELQMTSDDQPINIKISGNEDGKCHFTMAFNDVVVTDCNFSEDQLNQKVLNQLFGNDEGQGAVLAEACK